MRKCYNQGMSENNRITELENLIKKHQNLYYNLQPEISDAQFDALWDELKTLDPKNILFHSIPKDSSDGFAKMEHIIPMGSQEKAANPVDFTAWAEKMPFTEFLVQYKLDGASIELQYKNGIFEKAVTRGDGKIGDDITVNAGKMQGVIPELKGESGPGGKHPFTGGVRGEIIMTKSVHKEFFSGKANCRNAANGLMKRKDGSGSEHLKAVCYDAVPGTPGAPFTGFAPFSNEMEKLNWLKESGFSAVEVKLCKSAEEVIAYRSHVMDIRGNLDFDIDGLVVKSNEIDAADMKRARPEKQIAFKFSLEEAVSVIKEIQWSESGVTYTPVAVIEPVRLAGTTVKRASLANPNIISALNLKIGSRVIVTKRGEIIPKIESLVENPADTVPIEQPEICSACGTKLTDEGTRLYCANEKCPKLSLHRIEKWINVLDIKEFGTLLIKRLFESGRISCIPDLYKLTVEELAEVDRMGMVSAAKVLASLNAKNEIPLSKFLAGFDIEGIGEVMAEKLQEAGFNSLEELFNTGEEEFTAVAFFGDILAKKLVSELKFLKHEMYALLDSGKVKIKTAQFENKELSGKSFCFTGELFSMKRSQAQNLVKEKGGIVKSSVIKDLTYLVTNTPASGSAKNKKAAELGVKVITEEEFLKLVK